MYQHTRLLLSSFTIFLLLACGGGGSDAISRDGSSDGDDTPDPITYSVSLSLVNADGQTDGQLSASNPLTLTARVTDNTGAIATDQLVTFTFNPEGLAEFGNDSGTATTGTTGDATISLLVGENSGSGEVIATLSDGQSASTTFTSQGTTQENVQASSLDLFAGAVQLPSSGTDSIELIALVKNAQNVLMEGIDVVFSADADAALMITQGTTGADGQATATLTTQNNRQNRDIQITATSGTLSQTLSISVVGTTVNIDGPSSVILNDPVDLTLSLLDSDGNGIANQQVNLSAANGLLSSTTPTTGTNGQVTVTYTGNTAGVDTISASALNDESEFTVTVQADDFSFTTVPTEEVALNQATSLGLTWLSNTAPVSGAQVTLTTSRGLIATSTKSTDSDGLVSFSISADNAGFASISATGTDSDGNQVTARTQVEFVATQADSIIVDATPDSIGPTGEISTISAVVRDARGNLVKGKTINFLLDDVSGGQISPNQATTDRSGIAKTVYTSNALSTFEGVKVYGTVDDTQTVSAFTLLTVGDKPFDIVFGTGNTIQSPTESSYTKEFSAFVTDPDSNPVENANVTFSAPPKAFNVGGTYEKGFWTFNTTTNIWNKNVTAVCDNEDLNGNGILDEGEDINGDAQLTPGNVVAVQSQGITDANGQVLFTLSYPKAFGAWTTVSITANGESQGSESSEQHDYGLSVASDDLTDSASPPPANPYGESANCNDIL
ncbi:Ig-like domain-containing protein [Paraglaciecola chathamensis]|uniref:Invasin domain protein n=1 Tax=Paraglaciecola chathamensis S18K6 TaxID=1127672 RepID=A0AAV3UZJ3_9ALTE|nr:MULTISPECIES: Ig-like domain-containing protein [Paraglaciecola]MBN24355.1 invasin [Alteromonadaceae bacterium]GAC10236.1 invasin domain protein [Paraglaciecola chathamensis S18K6]|tara:strand:- start:130420 stop:132600 length:2181 start_codon:yes stop_codon:yes gene_type:complete